MESPGHSPNPAPAPELVAINGADGHSAPSPAAESPATPISNVPAPDVKIDLDYPEQESDVRNEPVDIKHVAPFDQDMNVVSHDTPINLVSHDVKMSEPHTNGVNGNHVNGDVDMHDGHGDFKNGDASSPASSTRERPNDDDVDEPPAKRPRILSDVDKTSMTHSATPPPVSANVSNAASPAPPPPSTAMTSTSFAATPTATPTGTPTGSPHSRITMAQFKYCQSCVRSLKKMKDATPFLRPVDTVALNIPHYNQIVRHPMDFSTIERKLNSSNPAKADPNPHNPRYNNVDEFVADVRLIFTNCLTFNGPDHLIVQMGKRVEEVFDKQMRSMPPSVEPQVAPKKESPPPPPPPVVSAPKKHVPVRRPSQVLPPVRRNEPEPISHRPKREIHPPPPKDLPYADAPKKVRKPVKPEASEQLKFCSKLLSDLHKKQYYNIAHPFYEPVDWVKMELPTYPKIVKKPMDLSTMRRKLDNRDYPTAQRFYDDFKLMIKNCMLFNPAGTPVCSAGQELDKVFNEKWRSLPPLRPVVSDEEEEEDEGMDSDAERMRAIAQMEAQIETMRANLEQLKSAAARSKKEKAKKKQIQEQRLHHRELPPPPSTSKPIPKQVKAPPKKMKKKPIPDDDVLTFEQKKDLSETIGTLEGAKLEKVINIIHEGVPEIRDSTEEIELEIDTLPASVLTKLYNFVIRPLKQPTAKRSRTGKGTGTGGLKRKSMDEDVEAEKIRQLEERMALFNQGASGGAPPPPPVRRGEGSDSDSSSGSSDSDSDSD